MRTILFFILFVAGVDFASAQNCTDFIERQYGYSEELDVEYGAAPNYEGNNVSLQMNIFKPVGDGNTQRPLLIMIHGGGFSAGHRNDFNELCRWYAERGYVAVTISYRLGLYHIINPVLAVDHHEMIRAIYRGMQDTRGAIRFMKGRAEQDSTDVDRVAVLGGSAGGFIALHTAYMDQPEEKPTSAGAIDPVIFAPRPDLGPIEGTLNLNGFSTEVQAAVNIFGGLRDTSLINSPNDPPIYAYHQTGDPVVHCHRNKPYWQDFPDTNNPLLDGSCAIQTKTDQLGFSSENAQFHLHDGNAHDIHDILQIDAEVAEFLNDHFCQFTTDVSNSQEWNVRVFPNPASDRIRISSTERLSLLRLLNVNGKEMLKKSVNTSEIELKVEHIARGVYVLQLVSRSGKLHQHKLILK